MENYASCVFGLEVQRLEKMPGNGFSLTVGIGCQPYHGRFFSFSLEVCHHLSLLGRYDILRSESVLYVYAQSAFIKISDMSDAGFYNVFVLAECLLQLLDLSR